MTQALKMQESDCAFVIVAPNGAQHLKCIETSDAASLIVLGESLAITTHDSFRFILLRSSLSSLEMDCSVPPEFSLVTD